MFKMEVEDETGIWSDVLDSSGKMLTFEHEEDARSKLAELYPVIVQMERYTGDKRTRVVRVFRTDQEWQDGISPN